MHWIDLTIMGVYIVACMVAGLLARGKEESTEDYFTAGGRLSNWFSTVVVGLSIAGTFFSGISFIAYPSVVYSHGVLIMFWTALFNLPLCYCLLRYWFLPRYLAGGWTYPYDIFEARFGSTARTVAASLYILVRVGWMAVMIYAPTIAVMTMGKLDDKWFWPLVLITGLTNTFFTVISGVRGVIVTEAIQMLVIIVGISATIAAAIWQLPVPLGTAWQTLSHAGRLNVFNVSLDPKMTLTVWSVTIGATFGSLGIYLADQMSLQRYLATGNVKATSRAFAVNVIGVVVVLGLLATVGLALFAYYAHVSDPNLPKSPDQIFPFFVATRLPVGVAGLLLAALLAATSIPSGINTLAGVLTLDFHARFKRGMTDRDRLRWAKIYSLVIGLSATATAGLVGRFGTVFDITQMLLGVLIAPLLGAIVIAVAGLRCRGWALVVGMLVGSAAGITVAISPAAKLWVSPASAGTTVIVALALSSFVRNRQTKPGLEVVVDRSAPLSRASSSQPAGDLT